METEGVLSRSVLLVVLPYRIGDAISDATAKTVRSFIAFPYGVLTLASYVRRFSKKIGRLEVLDLNLYDLDKVEIEFRNKLMFMRPDLIGFSMSYDVSYGWLKSLAGLAKDFDHNSFVVAGGPAITTAYTEILNECDSLDGVCYSEGELALKNLIDSDNMQECVTNDPWVTRLSLNSKKSVSPLYDDLDNIIDVDYSLIDIQRYSMKEAFSPFVKFEESARQFFVVTSRGCPFKCVFCAEPSFHGANMRYASVDRVVDHISFLKKNYGLNILTIYDDQILMNQKRAKELFAKLAELKIRIELPNGVTLSYIDKELARLMRKAGVDTLFLAIEHGSKRVLKDIIKKPIAFSRIKPTVEMLQSEGIFVCGFFVIGLPGERAEERVETRNAIFDWGLDWAFFNYATPLRGSELFRVCKENGWIADQYLPIGAIDMTEYVITAPGMDKEEIKDSVFNMNLDLNFVNNHNMRIGNFDKAYRSFREVLVRHPLQPFAHYFLAECSTALGKDISEAKRHLDAYEQIILSSPKWYAAAKHFGLKLGAGELIPVPSNLLSTCVGSPSQQSGLAAAE